MVLTYILIGFKLKIRCYATCKPQLRDSNFKVKPMKNNIRFLWEWKICIDYFCQEGWMICCCAKSQNLTLHLFHTKLVIVLQENGCFVWKILPHLQTYPGTHTHTHTHTHTRAYTHTHTYTHTQVEWSSSNLQIA